MSTTVGTRKDHCLAYLDRRILSIFFLGFSSGLPFLLTLSTLSIWLKESGISNTIIGLFVLATLPYTLKFLWAPLVDHHTIPYLGKWFGKRRSWALVSQVCLLGFLMLLGSSDPQHHIWETAFFALCVSMASATQDLVVEAYRIEIIDEDQVGVASTATTIGYRLGMLVSGAGALYLASSYPWHTVYTLMAGCVFLGMVTILFSPRTPHLKPRFAPASLRPENRRLRDTFLPPLYDLLAQYNWRLVVSFIILYKVGDTVLSVMSTPFLIEMGFSKLEIANIAKLFGISSMIIGGLAGGIFLTRFGILASLMLCCVLQIFSSLMFVVQALVGYNLSVLVITIGVENFSCGLGMAAFIAYLSSMCSTPNTATHFALLSSVGSLARVVLSMAGGVLADVLSWPAFFMVTALGCVPALILLMRSPGAFSVTESVVAHPIKKAA